jgi:hypothetical protein
MREYSPRRRTALVFAGTGTGGAYHAGALKALDEAGVKIDVVVGTGIGTLAATFAAVAGGPRLYGPGGFWEGVNRRALFRLRFAARAAWLIMGMAFAVFLLPVLAAILAGVLVVPVLILDVIAPGFASRTLATLDATPDALRGLYLSALAVPSFLISLLAGVSTAWALLKNRRHATESLEYLIDTRPARERALRRLWEVTHGSVLAASVPGESELGRRVVALVVESLGQPGFRELILRATDMETGHAASFILLGDESRATFLATRRATTVEGAQRVVDLRSPGLEAYLTDALLAGLLAPLLAPLRRLVFPKTGLSAGGTRRFADASLACGCGLADALAAGAEQIILVTGMPAEPINWAGRRGPWAAVDAVLATAERSGIEAELDETERLNRVVETVGHPGVNGQRQWQDPLNGRILQAVEVYVIRPERRTLGPLAFDGVRDSTSDLVETPEDLMQHGYQDAHRLFLGPVVGATAPPIDTAENNPLDRLLRP